MQKTEDLPGKQTNVAEYTIQMIMNQIETYHPNPQEIAKKYDYKKVKTLNTEDAQQWITSLMFILSDLFQEQIDNKSKFLQKYDQINISEVDKEYDLAQLVKQIDQVQPEHNLENMLVLKPMGDLEINMIAAF
jgi:hypothetical protein